MHPVVPVCPKRVHEKTAEVAQEKKKKKGRGEKWGTKEQMPFSVGEVFA